MNLIKVNSIWNYLITSNQDEFIWYHSIKFKSDLLTLNYNFKFKSFKLQNELLSYNNKISQIVNKYAVKAVTQSDIHGVVGVVLIVGIIFIFSNLIVDIVHLFLNPRLRKNSLGNF